MNDKGVHDLCCGFLRRCRLDYFDLLQDAEEHPDSKYYQRKVKDFEKEFRNHFIIRYLTIDADEILQKLRREVNYHD